MSRLLAVGSRKGLRNPAGSGNDLSPALGPCTRAHSQPGIRSPPGPKARARGRPALAQGAQDSSKMKSHFVPHAKLHPTLPLIALGAAATEALPRAQESPMALI